MTESIINSLQPFIQDVWNKSKFEQPSKIQEKAIPLILEGKDVIAESPTGTGKTLAYLLPVIERLDVEKRSPQTVILASSQELVMQIYQEFQKWSEGSTIRGASFTGGANMKRQLEKLKKSPQVIIGTPGRLLELIKQKKLKMHEVKTIVLDEADQLLVAEHIGTIQSIIKSTLSDNRQVLLFSATLSGKVEKLGLEMMKEPEVIKVQKEENNSANVEHIYITSEQRDKIKILEKISRLPNIKALVFVKDIGNLTVLAEKLQYKKIDSSILHSDLNKMERQKALTNFRNDITNLLIATDVAARGLDIKGVSHVVHYDFPKDVEQYIHRSGRTGRFGANGTIISIVTEREERELKRFGHELDFPVSKKMLFSGEIVEDRDRGTRNDNKNKSKRK